MLFPPLGWINQKKQPGIECSENTSGFQSMQDKIWLYEKGIEFLILAGSLGISKIMYFKVSIKCLQSTHSKGNILFLSCTLYILMEDLKFLKFLSLPQWINRMNQGGTRSTGTIVSVSQLATESKNLCLQLVLSTFQNCMSASYFFFQSLELVRGAQWKCNCFHIVLPPIDFAAVIFCAKSPHWCLYNRNQFSFELQYDGVVIFIHKQAKCVYSMSVCVCAFLPWLLSRRWLLGTQGNHSSPVNRRARYGGKWEKQEGGWVGQGMHDNERSSCIYLPYCWMSSSVSFTQLTPWPSCKMTYILYEFKTN